MSQIFIDVVGRLCDAGSSIFFNAGLRATKIEVASATERLYGGCLRFASGNGMTGEMGQQLEKANRKPRADSLRNRDLLLIAARDIFNAGGPDASLEAVARAAGLGIGTLYRHFPTREALFQAVYRREVDQLVDLAGALAAEGPPLEALRRWLHASIGMVATKKGMIAALAPATGSSTELFVDSAARLTRSVGDLMGAAIAAGQVRDDIAPEDVMRAVFGMCYTRELPGWQDTVVRLVDVFVDGLRLQKRGG